MASKPTSPPQDDPDEPHTGDDDLLDHISAAFMALDTAIDEDDDQYGPDARETVSAVMDDLEKASELRVHELKMSQDAAAEIARLTEEQREMRLERAEVGERHRIAVARAEAAEGENMKLKQGFQDACDEADAIRAELEKAKETR